MQEYETYPRDIRYDEHANEKQEKEGDHPFDDLLQRLFADDAHDKEVHADGRH